MARSGPAAWAGLCLLLCALALLGWGREPSGLDWQPDCIGIESSAGTVTTASSVQVREPIHRRSVEAWRKYQRQLEPLHRQLRSDGWLP